MPYFSMKTARHWSAFLSCVLFLFLMPLWAAEPVLGLNREVNSSQKENQVSKNIRPPKIRRIPPPKENFRVKKEIVDWIDEIDFKNSRIFKVFIDAGHGGKDEGAQGLFGTSEKAIVLRLAGKLRTQLTKLTRPANVQIKLSRELDEFISLRERVRAANEWGADAYVSIHANASVYQTPRGFEVYFLNSEPTDTDTRLLTQMENKGQLDESLDSDVLNILADVSTMAHIEESGRFAQVVYDEMSKVTEPNRRGVRQGPFTVLSGTQMPAILLEIGYVTNSRDAKMLARENYLNKLADAIGKGIVQYLERAKSLG